MSEHKELSPEAQGEQFIFDLRQALDNGDTKKTAATLQTLAETIHKLWGNTTKPSAHYNEMDKTYLVALASGTSGTRLKINTRSYDAHPNKLIFPNVSRNHKQNGKTLDVPFLALFGSKAININKDSSEPYFVIDLGVTTTTKEDE